MKPTTTILVILASTATLVGQTPTPTPSPTPKAPQVQSLAPPSVQFLSAPAPITVTQNFTLGWTDPNAIGDVTGYRLKYGSVSGTYTTTVDVPGQAAAGTEKTKTFTAFPSGDVFFVCTAYGGDPEVESQSTDEIGLTVTSEVPPGSPSVLVRRLVQFNSRSLLGSGNRAVVSSFKILEPCTVTIRVLGPSLPSSLKPATGTKVELRTTNGVLIEGNNGWQNGPDKQALIDAKLNPPNVKESALIAKVDPGVYNITTGYVGTSGIGQVELYETP